MYSAICEQAGVLRMLTEYRIPTTQNAPDVRFLYIFGQHSTNDWRTVQDLTTVKINYFVQGHSYIIVNGKAYAANSGDVLVYRPHELHYGHIPYNQEIEYFELQFDPDAFSAFTGGKELISWYMQNESCSTLRKLNAEQRNDLRDKFFRLRERILNRKECPLYALTMLMEILCEIRLSSAPAFPMYEGGYYPQTLMKALDMLHRHAHEQISNADIAYAASVSPSYLNRLFRQYLACTPHDYLLSYRISEACKFLLEGQSVTDTCFAAGFQDISTFGAVFKKFIGVSPSKFCKASESEDLHTPKAPANADF